MRQGLLLHFGRFLAQVHGVTEKATPVRYQVAAVGITVGGILGALLCGILSDRVFGSRRAPVAFIFYLGQIVALIALGFAASSYAAVILVGFACLWIFGVHGMLSGTASMDFGGKRAAATATGLLDGVQYLGSGFGRVRPRGVARPLQMVDLAVRPLMPFSIDRARVAPCSALWNARPAKSN